MKHIEIMLKFRGFHQAKISEEKHDTKDQKKLTVHYTISCEKDLDDYLKNHALTMREEGIKRFGDKFSAFRRLFSEPLIVNGSKHN